MECKHTWFVAIQTKNTLASYHQIGAIQNSSEYRLGIRKNARVNPNGKFPIFLFSILGSS